MRDRLTAHLAGLTPDARAMILRRYEKTGLPMRLTSEPSEPAAPAEFDAFEYFFRPFAPFVIDEVLEPRQPGWLHPKRLQAIWSYLSTDAMASDFAPWKLPLPDTPVLRAAYETDLDVLRRRALSMLEKIARTADEKARMRFVSRIGGEDVVEDVLDMVRLQDLVAGLDRLRSRLPVTVAGEAAERLVAEGLRGFLEANPAQATFAALVLAERAASAASLVRVAVLLCKSSDVVDLRRSPAARFVDVALSAADRSRVRLKGLLASRSEAAAVTREIRALFETLRGATTAVKFDDDKVWRHRLTQIRTSASDLIAARLDDLLPALRRAFRMEGSSVPEPLDVADAVHGVAIFTVTRRHREMTALNEAVGRIGNQAEQAIDHYARLFLEALRKAKGDRRQKLIDASGALVQVAEMLHGAEHAQILRKAVDVARRQSEAN